MLKSLGFFLAVFAVGLVGLLFVSGDISRWWKDNPAPLETGREPARSPAVSSSSTAGAGEAAGQKPGDSPEKPAPDEIKIPVYDVVKGRLEYTFRGRLD